MKEKLLIALLFLLGLKIAQAQPEQPNYKTPEASALAKSIEYPANNCTGIPSIVVPLFKVLSGSLNYNVQLSYHAAGIKVGQLPGWLGLNWSINSVPQITRKINGRSDFNGYLQNYTFGAYNDNPITNLSNEYLNNLNKGMNDEQPDEFDYSLMNKSGKFMFQKYNDQSYKAMPIPYDQLDIQFHNNTGVFTILDADGTKYEFGGTGFVEQTYLSSSPVEVTAWKCKMIVSANLKDTITFDYQPIHTKYRGVFSEQVELYDGAVSASGTSYSTPIYFTEADLSEQVRTVGVERSNPVAMKVYSGAPNPFINTFFVFAPLGDQAYNFGSPNIYFDNDNYQPEPYGNTTVMQIMDIKQINYKGNKVEFFSRISPYEALDSIRITNYLGQYVRSIKFDNPGALSGLKFSSGQSNNEVYKFDYLPGPGFDSETNIPTDAWGYPNPSNGPPGNSLDMFNGSTIPYQWVNSTSFSNDIHYDTQSYSFPIGNTFLTSNEDDMKGGMLKKITYPDGGFTEFEFEANRYLRFSLDTMLAGGLRIKNIKNYTSGGTIPASEKYFKYGNQENGIGFITADPQLYSFEYDQIGHFQSPHPDYNYNPGNLDIPNFRKRTYVKSSLDINAFSNGAVVNYPYVTVYDSESGQQTGKTSYGYNINHSNSRVNNTTVTRYQTDIENGQLQSETYYAYVNGGFVWQRSKRYSYESYLFPEKIHVGKVFNRYVLLGDIRPGVGGRDPDVDYGLFDYTKFGLNVGYSRIIKETDSTRNLSNLSNVIGTQKLYYYDNVNHIYPTRIVYQNSKNETLVTYTSYPQDYAADNDMTSSLIANHKLNYPIEKVVTKRGGVDKILSAFLNQYLTSPENYYNKSFAMENSGPIPITNFKFSNVSAGQWPENGNYQILNKDSKYSEKSKFLYDSHGNVAQVTNYQQQNSTFIWSYRGTYPVIELKNIDYASIQSALGSSVLSAFENSSPDKYTIDNLVATIKVAYPAVFVSSYVYKPLVGMTSMTDVKGMTTTYEYDSFQRLVNVKDANGKILKHTDYHYKQ